MKEKIAVIISRLVVRVWRLKDWNYVRPFMCRTSAHGTVLALTLVVIALSSVSWQIEEKEIITQNTNHPVTLRTSFLIEGNQVRREANPHTEIPWRPRSEIITYTVRYGDTVQSIADRFFLDPTSVVWSNPEVERTPDLLRVGQEIVILPIDGVYHTVTEGDTTNSIAREYGVTLSAIRDCEYNSENGLVKGARILVPGGEKPYEARYITSYTGPLPEEIQGTGSYQWPILGRISQDFWYAHRAIDIAAPVGTAILASDSGFVTHSGWSSAGYGLLVILDHGNDSVTYYAHMSEIYVEVEQEVEKGQVLGVVGNTGRSTGPHIHFEIRVGGVQENPRLYLP